MKSNSTEFAFSASLKTGKNSFKFLFAVFFFLLSFSSYAQVTGRVFDPAARPCVKIPASPVVSLPATAEGMAAYLELRKSQLTPAQRTAAAPANTGSLPVFARPADAGIAGNSNNVINPIPTNDLTVPGTLTITDPTYNRSLSMTQGGTCGLSAVGTAVHYKTHSLTLVSTSQVTVSLLPADGATITPAAADTYLALYGTAGFTPSAACTNLIMANDDAGSSLSKISTTTALPAGTYTIVVSSFDNTPTGAGALPWTYTLAVTANTAAPCTPGNIIADGGFETSTDNGTVVTNPSWTSTSTNFTTSFCDVALCGTGGGAAPPRTGNFWAWFGGTSSAETGVVQQSVTIPSGVTATLNYYLRIGTVNTPFNATLKVLVDGVVQTTYTEPSVAEAAYTLRTLNMNAFANGAAHVIRFEYVNPAGSGTSNFTVDDVTLDISCTPPATPPTVTINQAAGQADPTSASPILFTVTFSEPVTGFTASDITLSGTALPTTVTISGTGPVYTASVSGMSVSGTVIASIAANMATSTASSLGNTASTSTDNTVTYNVPAGTCVLTCPANITVSNTAGSCGAVVTFPAPTSTGTCGAITSTPASGSFFPVGTTTVTSTSGTATCTFTVRVNDTQAPVITCPANITVNNTAGTCGAAVTFTPTATDNCPGTVVTSSPASGSVFPKGTTTVTVTATDAAGNTSTCTFTVTVNDTQAPVVTCPANITVNNTAGTCGAAVTFTPTATDNCTGTITIVSSPASGSVFPVGLTTVNVTATDAAGNAGTCSFTVRVNDTQLPVITCPANINVTSATGQCTAVVNFTPTATDNCPGVVVTSVPASGSAFPLGATTVTSKATDAAGNIATCTFTVIVADGQLPVISTQPANTGACEGSNATFNVTATNAVSYQWQSLVSGVFTDIAGATSATYTVQNVNISQNQRQYRVRVIGLCTTITSNAATLTVNRNPVVILAAASYTSINPSVQSGLFTTVSPPSTYNYQYKRNGVVVAGVNSPSLPLSVDVLGTYTVTVTDAITGCSTTSAAVTVKDSVTGRLIFIYPNPNTGVFTVRFRNTAATAGTHILNVYSSSGARVFSKQYPAAVTPYDDVKVNISGMAKGVYYVELKQENGDVLASGSVFKQ